MRFKSLFTLIHIAYPVILHYDWILMFDMEIKHVWQAPKTTGVWLFLINRYFTTITVSSRLR